MDQGKVLLLTVGTGDLRRLRESLLTPLKKSIADGEWNRVILLPSQVTQEHGLALRDEMLSVPELEIHPLPEAGQEDDADSCFEFYDAVIRKLKAEGYGPNEIVLDFTRGTKAMSAALVLAGVRHELPTLRYLTGQRDERGMVKAGTERVHHIPTTVATAMKRLDTARAFMAKGNFAAALDSLPTTEATHIHPWPQTLEPIVNTVRSWCMFYGAWDRLDYRSAAAAARAAAARLDDEWGAFAPDGSVRAWVERLATIPEKENVSPKKLAVRLRDLVADLLANGERRIRDGQYEDAILRAYRVVELVGQIRLFARGYDSACLPADDPEVIALQRELEKKKSVGLEVGKKGKLMAGRFQVARLLKRLGDPLHETLLAFERKTPGGSRRNDENLLVSITARNHSVLIHGFRAVGPGDEKPLRELYERLEELLVRDDPEGASARLAVARRLDLTKAVKDSAVGDS